MVGTGSGRSGPKTPRNSALSSKTPTPDSIKDLIKSVIQEYISQPAPGTPSSKGAKAAFEELPKQS
ncbi:hypothetical protein MCOR25_002559 [Pyricularia grisea]|nr:hypothetical protein MCOR25_002559 [Pyricularia grisea]